MTSSTIKILKFGGASIKDAASIRNAAAILSQYRGEAIVVVISAMGKTTNSLEAITNAYFTRNGDAVELLQRLKHEHFQILTELFFENVHPIFDDVNNTFVEIDWILEDEPHEKYDYLYDQIVSVGETVASKIVSAYLNYKNISAYWLDVRDCIKTDNTYREGKVEWVITEKNIRAKIPFLLKDHFVLT
ncbi:MAG: aspartate kinase, partial [Chitinophagales bacterium]|nr:aspartate kinase [Chitinophagales bacterium]